MYTALEIAVWFLGAIDRKAGDGITHLKLQKLVYYAQAWSLALLDRPLFDEVVEAWTHGPVVESVFQRFKDAGWENLPRLARKTEIDQQTVLLLRGVLATYGEHTARFLEDLTHREAPWQSAREGLSPTSRSRRVIPASVMKSYYRRQRERQEKAPMNIDLSPLGIEELEAGLVVLPPLADDHLPADHLEYMAQVDADLAARQPRRRRNG
jgi:uncharacterized phage-associated protein